jgi:serine/threonine protein kinase
VSHFALKPGTSIDGYEVLDLLGRGGMGAVYRVRREGHEYALKTLSLETSGVGSEESIRFRREVEILAALDHPGIVGIHSSGQKPGFCYYVMELVAGESLNARLKRGGPLDPAEAIELTLEIADAVSHAHERGIVHRDLKPANILMDEAGRPLVTDFGLARKLGESESERLTRTGEILGTPAYLAPEQAFGLKEELDEIADVYGLGALLYAMLAGHAPFEGPTALVVMKKVSTESPIPLENVPPELEAFVHRAMAKRREDRPPSARAFLEELEALNQGPGISTSTKALVLVMLAFVAVTIGFLAARQPWRRGANDDRNVPQEMGKSAAEPASSAAPIDSLVAEAARALFRSDTGSAEKQIREASARDAPRTSAALVTLCTSELGSLEHVRSIMDLARRTHAVLPGGDTSALEDVAVASSALALIREKSGIFDRNLVALKEQCRERDPLPAPLATACSELYDRALKPPPNHKRLVELFPLPPSAEQRVAVASACMEHAKADMAREFSSDPDEAFERIRMAVDLLRVAVRWDPRVSPLPKEFQPLFSALAAGAGIEQEIRKRWQTAFSPSPGHLGYPTHPYVYYLAAHDARQTIEFYTTPPADSAARLQWEKAVQTDDVKAQLERARETLLDKVKACFEAVSPEKDPTRTTVLERWLAGELLDELAKGRPAASGVGPFAERLASFAGTKEAWENAAELFHALDSPDRARAATEQAQKAPSLDSF